MEYRQWNEQRDGQLSEANLRQKLENLGYTVHRFHYAPGTVFATHTHGVDKIDAVLEGCMRIVVQEREYILEPGDWVAVPSGVLHSAEVVGDVSVVSLDAVFRG